MDIISHSGDDKCVLFPSSQSIRTGSKYCFSASLRSLYPHTMWAMSSHRRTRILPPVACSPSLLLSVWRSIALRIRSQVKETSSSRFNGGGTATAASSASIISRDGGTIRRSATSVHGCSMTRKVTSPAGIRRTTTKATWCLCQPALAMATSASTASAGSPAGAQVSFRKANTRKSSVMVVPSSVTPRIPTDAQRARFRATAGSQIENPPFFFYYCLLYLYR